MNPIIIGSLLFLFTGSTCLSQTICITGTARATTGSCKGAANGQVVVTVNTGAGPFEYSIDNGNFQSSATFNTLMPGDHSVIIRNTGGCVSGPLNVRIDETPGVSANGIGYPSACMSKTNGVIEMTITAGHSPYGYTLDGNRTQANNIFYNVAEGSHEVMIKDGVGCTSEKINVLVGPGEKLLAKIDARGTSCNMANGTITVRALNGFPPFNYLLDGIIPQPSGVFQNVAAGSHSIFVTDIFGCSSGTIPVEISADGNFNYDIEKNNVSCYGLNDGSIIVQPPSNMNSPLRYSLDNVTYQTGNQFRQLTPGNYTIYVRDQAGCVVNSNVSIEEPLKLELSAVTIDASCTGGNDGSIRFTSSGGSLPHQYSIDGNNFTTGSSFTSAPGIFKGIVKDVAGCTAEQNNIEVGLNKERVKVTIVPADTIVQPGSRFNLRVITPASTYKWDANIGITELSVAAPTITAGNFGDDIRYRVQIKTSNGCEGEGFSNVKVYRGPDIYIPDAFTPNDDGKNDFFIPFAVGIKELVSFMIFNRWGQVVYNSKINNQGWDGRTKGVRQPNGVYIWVIHAITSADKKIERKGTLNLVR